MKYFIFIILLIYVVPSHAQRQEINQGVYFNKFYESTEDLRFTNDYESGSGYSVRFAYQVESFKILSWRLSFGFERYGGRVQAADGGNGGGFRIDARFNKSLITAGVYPINFRFWNRLNLNFGFEISGTIADHYEGTRTSYVILPSSSMTEDLKDAYSVFNSSFHFGLGFRMAYDFKISDQYIISPQYGYYHGLTSEFSKFPKETKSMRHYIRLGIIKQI